jgi:hypothetical protein
MVDNPSILILVFFPKLGNLSPLPCGKAFIGQDQQFCRLKKGEIFERTVDALLFMCSGPAHIN